MINLRTLLPYLLFLFFIQCAISEPVECNPPITNCYSCQSTNPKSCESCNEGYTLYRNKCYKCPDICKECKPTLSPTLSDCSECVDGYYLEMNNGNYGTCFQCPLNCKKCNDADICIECENKYYLDSTVCHQCHESCLTCTGPNHEDCASCNDGFYNNPETQLCEPCLSNCISCFDGYFLNSGSCNKCHESCKKCDNYDLCSECADGYFWDNTNHCVKFQTNAVPISVSVEEMTLTGRHGCYYYECPIDDSNPYCGANCWSYPEPFSLEYTFLGEAFQIFGTFDSYHGSYNVYLDGEFLTSINQSKIPRQMKTLQYTSDVLEYKNHTLLISSDSSIFEISKITYWPQIKAKRINATEFTKSGRWYTESDRIGGTRQYASPPSYATLNLTFNKFWFFGSKASHLRDILIIYDIFNATASEYHANLSTTNYFIYESPKFDFLLNNITITSRSRDIVMNCVFYLDTLDPTMSPTESPSFTPEETPQETPQTTPTPARSLLPFLPVFTIPSKSDTFVIDSNGFIDNKGIQVNVDNSTESIKAISYESQKILLKEGSSFISNTPLYFISSIENSQISIDENFRSSNIGVFSTNHPTLIIKNNDIQFLSLMNSNSPTGQITIEFDNDRIKPSVLMFNEVYNQIGEFIIEVPSEIDEFCLSKLTMKFDSSLSIYKDSRTQRKQSLESEDHVKLRVVGATNILSESRIAIDNLKLNGTLNMFSDSKLRIENEIEFIENSLIEIIIKSSDHELDPILSVGSSKGVPEKIILKAGDNLNQNSDSHISIFSSKDNSITCSKLENHLFLLNNSDDLVNISPDKCNDSSEKVIIIYSFLDNNDDNNGNNNNDNSGNDNNNNGNRFPIGAIIGIVVGIVVFIAIIVVIVIFVVRWNKNQSLYEDDDKTTKNNDDDSLTENEIKLAI